MFKNENFNQIMLLKNLLWYHPTFVYWSEEDCRLLWENNHRSYHKVWRNWKVMSSKQKKR